MPLDRRNGEIGNILVFDRILHLDIVGEIAQTRTENDPHLGGKLPDLRTDKCGGLKNLINIFFKVLKKIRCRIVYE